MDFGDLSECPFCPPPGLLTSFYFGNIGEIKLLVEPYRIFGLKIVNSLESMNLNLRHKFRQLFLMLILRGCRLTTKTLKIYLNRLKFKKFTFFLEFLSVTMVKEVISLLRNLTMRDSTKIIFNKEIDSKYFVLFRESVQGFSTWRFL